MTSLLDSPEKLLTTDDWFNGIIAKLRQHQSQIKENVAPSEVKNFYTTFVIGTPDEIVHQGKRLSHSYFVAIIVEKYIGLIKDFIPEQLAFAYTNSEILVWAELKDDDFDTERNLILAAAKVNSEYHKFGYTISSVFVEEGDNLPIPNHYQLFKTKSLN